MFDAGSTEGRIIGANAGYDDNGIPIRKTTQLKEGDVIVPVYTLYYADPDDNSDKMQEMEFDGDKIIWTEGLKVTYKTSVMRMNLLTLCSASCTTISSAITP